MGLILQGFALGGPAMWVLALMSVAALTLIILKLWEFAERRVAAREFVQPALAAWTRGDLQAACEALDGSASPLAQVLAATLRWQADPRLDEAQARERAERAALDALESLRGHLRALELIGSLAPLLGLLGTVLGMIGAFQALEAAGDRVQPAILSAGIWQALLTTAAGLIIAIPAVAAVGYFDRRIEQLQHAMESALTQVLTSPRPRN